MNINDIEIPTREDVPGMIGRMARKTAVTSVSLLTKEMSDISRLAGPFGGSVGSFCATAARSHLQLRPESIMRLVRATHDTHAREQLEKFLEELDRVG